MTGCRQALRLADGAQGPLGKRRCARAGLAGHVENPAALRWEGTCGTAQARKAGEGTGREASGCWGPRSAGPGEPPRAIAGAGAVAHGSLKAPGQAARRGGGWTSGGGARTGGSPQGWIKTHVLLAASGLGSVVSTGTGPFAVGRSTHLGRVLRGRGRAQGSGDQRQARPRP